MLIVLYKYRMLDPALFYLTLELCDSNPSQEGLTKKTQLTIAVTEHEFEALGPKNSSSIHLPDTSLWRRLEDSQEL